MSRHKSIEKIEYEAYRRGYRDGWNARGAKYEKDNSIYHCRDCKYLCGEEVSVGIECMNPEKQAKWSEGAVSRYRKPSDRACKAGFEKKDEEQ